MIAIIAIIRCLTGWLKSIGSRIVFELDHRKRVLYVIPKQNIMGKMPVVHVRVVLRDTVPGTNHSTSPPQRLSSSRCTRRPQTGIRRWLPDVVCQLVGIAMVLGYFMKGKRVWRVMPHGARPHVNVLQRRHHQLKAENAFNLGRATAGGQIGCDASVFGGWGWQNGSLRPARYRCCIGWNSFV